jgi:hypothetical protein
MKLEQGKTYTYEGLVTGPFKMHKATIDITYNGTDFDVKVDQAGDVITFTAQVKETVNETVHLITEPFTPPTTSEFTNMVMVCNAQVSDEHITGVIDIPAYSVKVTLEGKRTLQS